MTGLLLLQCPQAFATPVQVFDCQFLVTNGPIPSESLLGNFIIRRHIEDADPFQTTETSVWAEGKFADEGYFDVLVLPIEGNPVSERSANVQTTILDGNESIGDSYLDEALTMEKTVSFEGYTLDSIKIIYERTDGSALDSHLVVPKEFDPSKWDPYPGCGQFGCPVECAVVWRVPDDPLRCGTPNSPNLFCTTGSYVGRITSVTHEPHEHEHGSVFAINSGLNDAWVNMDAPLQGMFVTVFPDLNLMFLAWFTFDSEIPIQQVPATFGSGDQRWVTAVGTITGNKASLKAEKTSGGTFNGSEPTPSQELDYGTIDLEFTSCKEGKVTFNFPSAGESGEFAIKRVLEDSVPLCEAMSE